ncbi:MAG: hypothetical protein WCI45_12340, partial [Desulfuromonadales bacterium]
IPTHADEYYKSINEDSEVIPTHADEYYKLLDMVIPTYEGGQENQENLKIVNHYAKRINIRYKIIIIKIFTIIIIKRVPWMQ